MRSIADVVADRSMVICAGSGGVGKTTVAAALALHGAESGRRTIVLTIDPARRLADAMGLGEIGNEAFEVSLKTPGSLSAMMLDQKGAWDKLVEHHTSSEEVRRRIFANPFYQHLSQSFAGSQEYMAIEQLAELRASGDYDLIVVDTPPTQHALDFLDAPQRIADFLSRDIIRWFVKPYFSAGWATLRLMNRTAGALLRRLEDATGISALVEISDFFTSMSELFESFEARVERVNELLRSDETAFILVAGPEEQTLTEAEYFFRKVGDLSVALRAVVFNRVHRESELELRASDEKRLRALVKRVLHGSERAERFVDNFFQYETLARGDAVRIEAFAKQIPAELSVVTVPNFDEDLHDLDGLRRMIPYFTATKLN